MVPNQWETLEMKNLPRFKSGLILEKVKKFRIVIFLINKQGEKLSENKPPLLSQVGFF